MKKIVKFFSIVTLTTLILVELVLRSFFPLHWRQSRYFTENQKLLREPNHSKRLINDLDNGKIIFDVTYQFDRFGRRAHKQSKGAKKFAIFFGGSFAFGSGLPENETLAYYFMKENKEVQVYDYAFRSYGPNHMLSQIRSIPIEKQIPEHFESGDVYFFSYVFHTERYMGSARWLAQANTNDPYFKLESGKIVNHGNFATGKPISTWLAWAFHHSQIIKYYFKGFEYPTGEESQRTLCAIVNQADRLIRKKFTDKVKNFYFVVSPFQDAKNINRYYSRVRECLSSHIKYIKVHAPINYQNEKEKYVIDKQYDIHPNKLANEWLSKNLDQ